MMLRLSTYEAIFDCESPVTLHGPCGELWHSVVGKALRDITCVRPGTNCQKCKLQHACDYPALFNTPRPPTSTRMPGYNYIPAPHIFQQRVNQQGQPVRDEPNSRQLRMRFSLVDRANMRIHTVLACLAQVAANGFGKDRIRAEMVDLMQVEQNGACSSCSVTATRAEPAEIIIPPLADDDKTVRIEFITPYRQPGKRGNNPAEFDLSALLIAVVRRIDLLKEFHSDGKLQLDFRSLKALTLRSDLATARLKQRKAHRYSASHGKTVDMSGLLGTVDLYGSLATRMWPWLNIGSRINVGKNASMGSGQYRLTTMNEAATDEKRTVIARSASHNFARPLTSAEPA